MDEPHPLSKNLEDIIWKFIAERMILQKELYEKIYENDLFEEYKKEDMYIEFGQTFETVRWINIIRSNFDIDIFNDALFVPIGSELFEKARMIIKNTILIDVVTKIEIIPGDNPKIIPLKFSSPEEDIPVIKNFLRTL